MNADPASRRYTAAIILFHWTCAALVLLNIWLGLTMVGASGLAKFTTFQLHKSIGFTVLALTVARLGFRLFGRRPPAFPPHMRPWENVAARATHWSFYGLMLGLPLTGWVIVSASPTNIPTLLYKTVPVPHIGWVHGLSMPVRRSVEHGFDGVHVTLAWSAIALIVLHVGAALKHQFRDRDDILWRMAPIPGRRPSPLAGEGVGKADG